MRKILYLDTEWANSKNKSICQLGLVSEDFDTEEPIFPELNLYINPEDFFDRNCVAVHKIPESKVKKCPTFKEVWPEIEKYFINSIVVGHNVKSADLDAIDKNLKRYNIDSPVLYYIDTYELSKKLVRPDEVNNYQLSTLCNYFDIDIDNEHDAFDDACACSDLLKKLVEVFNIKLEDYTKKYQFKEEGCFTQYVTPMEFRRELNTLYGVLSGMELDKKIDEKECIYIKKWLKNHKSYVEYASVKHIIKVVEMVLQDGVITNEEMKTLKSVISMYLQEIKSSRETLATQFLQGLIKGIKADAKIDDTEIYKLQKWLYNNSFLEGHYPYDKLIKIIGEILEDDIITFEEKRELEKVFNELDDPVNTLNEAIVKFDNQSFCLSGDFSYGSKAEVSDFIISHGGIIDKTVKKSTKYVVVGEKGSANYSNGKYGIKVKKAIELGITILKESQLFN